MNVRGLGSVAFTLVAAVGLALLSSTTFADTVDDFAAHCGTGPVSGAFDAAYDSSDDSLWVLDQGSGTICHYTLSPFPPEISFDVTIVNPFPAATFPFFTPVCRGITFNPIASTLVVLNTTTAEIQQIDNTGTPAGAAVTLAPGGLTPTLHGLAWDTINNTIWSRDVANNTLREFDPLTGNELSTIPIPAPVGDIFFGDSLHFLQTRGTGFLELSYGDIFSGGVTRTIRLDMSGATTGVEVDLTEVLETVLGTVRSPGGSTLYVTSADNVYKMTCSDPMLVAPTDLSARSDNNGNFQLTWNNHGPLVGGDYDSIQIVRNATVLEPAALGNTTTYFDTTPPDGTIVTYSVMATVGLDTVTTSIDVRTGSGALVDHTLFGGTAIYDVALNTATGNLLVSESTPLGTPGRLFEYDSDLNLIGSLTTDVDQIRGIAFDSVRNILIITRGGNSNLTRLDVTTGQQISSFTTSMSNNLGCASYDPIADTYLVQDLGTGSVYAVDADPTVPAPPAPPVPGLGQTIWTCAPPIITGLNFAAGVTVLPPDLLGPDGYFMAPVHDGDDLTVQTTQFQLDTCFPTGFSVPFTSLGATVTDATNSVRGIEDIGNVLYVCNQSVNTIFKVLLAPGGSNFIRGDGNQDSAVDAGDVLFILNFLYAAGTTPICFDACDSNDDGRVDTSDALYLIFYLFQPTGLPSSPFPNPPSPFPAAGPDPTFVDVLGC